MSQNVNVEEISPSGLSGFKNIVFQNCLCYSTEKIFFDTLVRLKKRGKYGENHRGRNYV